MSIAELDILFETDDLIAINKPHGLLVHRTPLARDAKEFALQLVRDHVGTRVYPAHRLDRKTSGVLIFSKHQEANVQIQQMFDRREIHKVYHAIVRGYTEDQGVIDYPLTDRSKTKEAITLYQTIARYDAPWPQTKHPSSRYSLVELIPETGRFHQLRKHLAHIFHPIIGDRPHGCNKQNRFWKEKHQMTHMMLCATRITFTWDDLPRDISASYSSEMARVISILDPYRAKDT